MSKQLDLSEVVEMHRERSGLDVFPFRYPKERRRMRELARRMDEAMYVENYDLADSIGKEMDKLERGASRRALDALNAGRDPASPWIHGHRVDLVVWHERGGPSGTGWFYRFPEEREGTAYGPYRTRAGARAGGRRRAAAEGRPF